MDKMAVDPYVNRILATGVISHELQTLHAILTYMKLLTKLSSCQLYASATCQSCSLLACNIRKWVKMAPDK